MTVTNMFIFFTLSFGAAAFTALMVYWRINADMYHRPFRFLLVAVIPVVTAFLFQLIVDVLVALLEKIHPNGLSAYEWKAGLAFFNNIASIMAGAIVGVAVNNRAMILNGRRVKEIRRELNEFKKQKKPVIRRLRAILCESEHELSPEEKERVSRDLASLEREYRYNKKALKRELKERSF